MRLALLLVALVIAGSAPVAAQSSPATEQAEAERRQRQRDLETIRRDMERTQGERRRIEREIAAIRADRAALVRAGIETAARAQALEARIVQTEARLAAHDADEARLRASLDDRRGLIAEVLASLQRMGRRPPPALLVAPEDVLKSVRTAMLLGTLLPDMRQAARLLARDLEALAATRRAIAAERETLAAEQDGLTDERIRLDALAAARQAQVTETERNLDAEKLRAAGLARQAGDLELLIARMETEIAAAHRAAEAARTSVVARAATPLDRRAQMAALQNAARISPAIPFERTRGTLNQPVIGVRLREFGSADSLGGIERGQSFATRAGASVVAPADGWVVYSGPFRTYGQLLILNAGDGYHLVLAGMERISVDLGQFVLAGEPVGAMGDAPPPAAAVATGSTQPVLYVEFRKDGATIDPAPWWARRPAGNQSNERVRG